MLKSNSECSTQTEPVIYTVLCIGSETKDKCTDYGLKPTDFLRSPRRKRLSSNVVKPTTLYDKLSRKNEFVPDLTKVVFCNDKNMYFVSQNYLFSTKDPIEFSEFFFKYLKTGDDWRTTGYFLPKNLLLFGNAEKSKEEWIYANDDNDIDKIILPADSLASHFSLSDTWDYMETFYAHLIASLINFTEVMK